MARADEISKVLADLAKPETVIMLARETWGELLHDPADGLWRDNAGHVLDAKTGQWLDATGAAHGGALELWADHQGFPLPLSEDDKALVIDDLQDRFALGRLGMDAPAPPMAFKPFSLKTAMAEVKPRSWLYGRHYIRGFLSITLAPGGVGKSSLALVEAVAMATGRPLLGASPHRPLRVVYWCGEDPEEEIWRRIWAICRNYGVTEEEIGGRLFVASGRDLKICLARQGRKGVEIDETAKEALTTALKGAGADVAIFDPLVTLHQVPENDNTGLNAVMDALRDIADETQTAIELIHHVRKGATQEEEMGADAARGASAIIGAVRSARALNPMQAAEAERLGLESRQGFFFISSAKANLAPPIEKRGWLRLIGVYLDNGAPEYPEGDSVGVVVSWKALSPIAGVTSSQFDDVVKALASGEGRENAQAEKWAGYVVAEVMGLDLGPSDKRERTSEQTAARAKAKGILAELITAGRLMTEDRPAKNNGRKEVYVVPTSHSLDEHAP